MLTLFESIMGLIKESVIVSCGVNSGFVVMENKDY